jgi:hypothetical protein
LINITKTNSDKCQNKLNKEKLKKSGMYNLPEVVKELKSDFYSKCYLCEQKTTSANIEHFKPHREDINIKFDINNLYLACSHCNSIKGTQIDILDCADENDDVEKQISYYMDVYPKSKVIIRSSCKNHDKKVENTVELLNKIYNGTTPLGEMNSDEIKSKLRNEMRRFYELLLKYIECNVEEMRLKALEEIEESLHQGSEFCIFKHWFIKKQGYEELSNLIRV